MFFIFGERARVRTSGLKDLWRDTTGPLTELKLWIRNAWRLQQVAYRINVTIRDKVRVSGRIAEK
jgi:hypothetical protein